MAVVADLRSPKEALQSRNECRHVRGICGVDIPELHNRLPFLDFGEPDVHDRQDWKHRERQQRRPLHEEPEHHQNKADILRVTDVAVGPSSRQSVSLLGIVERSPSHGDQYEPAADKDVAKDMEQSEMRFAFHPNIISRRWPASWENQSTLG